MTDHDTTCPTCCGYGGYYDTAMRWFACPDCHDTPTSAPTDEVIREAIRQLRDHFMLPSVSQRSIDILEAEIARLAAGWDKARDDWAHDFDRAQRAEARLSRDTEQIAKLREMLAVQVLGENRAGQRIYDELRAKFDAELDDLLSATSRNTEHDRPMREVVEAALHARRQVALGRMTSFEFEQHVCAALTDYEGRG